MAVFFGLGATLAFIVSLIFIGAIPCEESGLGWQGWVAIVAGLVAVGLTFLAAALALTRKRRLLAIPLAGGTAFVLFILDFEVWFNSGC